MVSTRKPSYERSPASSGIPLEKCYSYETVMKDAKHEVESLLQKLPDNCSLEEIQYHLYVLDKVKRGLNEAHQQGGVSQEEAEKRLSRWLTE